MKAFTDILACVCCKIIVVNEDIFRSKVGMICFFLSACTKCVKTKRWHCAIGIQYNIYNKYIIIEYKFVCLRRYDIFTFYSSLPCLLAPL